MQVETREKVWSKAQLYCPLYWLPFHPSSSFILIFSQLHQISDRLSCITNLILPSFMPFHREALCGSRWFLGGSQGKQQWKCHPGRWRGLEEIWQTDWQHAVFCLYQLQSVNVLLDSVCLFACVNVCKICQCNYINKCVCSVC